jgi:phosphatidylglycerol---prolipoprotein diacylglyceryl transferase
MTTFAIPFPMIDPVLVSIGPFAIRWYALSYIVGLVGGWLYAKWLASRPSLWLKPPPAAAVEDLLVYVAVGIILGGRIGYVLFYNFGEYLKNPLDAFAIWKGGMSFHGGLAGGALAVFLLARRHATSALGMFDLACAVAPIGLFFGRIANFINGELWGRPAPDFPYAVIFPNGGPVPRHASQIYEAFAEGLVLFVVLAVVVRLGGFKRPGLVCGVFAAAYAVARMVCEFFREPDAQLGFLFGQSLAFLGGGITMGMVLSLPLFLIGIALIAFALRRARRHEQAVASEAA